MEEKIYAISYDLKQPGRNYEDLYEKLQSYLQHFHALESTWFIKTIETADVIYDKLRVSIDDNDHLLITEINPGNKQGWMIKSFWTWVNGNN